MNWLKHSPLLGSVLALIAASLVTETWLWSQGHAQARRALAALELKKLEREQLAHQSPALDEQNELAIARDLANTREVVAALRAALRGGDAALLAAAPPAKSIDLYFDIAAFVEKTRALATRAQVTARPDERFGFASCASTGPEADLVSAVFRQRVIGQYLIEALFDSHPRALLAVQREQPLTAAQRIQRHATAGFPRAGRPGEQADFFEGAGPMLLRAPGRLDSEAFRLEFTGQTSSLRAFLNTLATFQLPLVVRSVEVEPTAPEAAGTNPAALPVPGTLLPSVTRNLSRFTVVVECIQPVAAREEPIL